MAVITISKQYGCSAEEVSNRVCKTLGYKYFEKRNILQIAEEAGISDSDLFDLTVDELEKKNFYKNVMSNSVQTPMIGFTAAGTAGYGMSMSTYMNYSETLNREHALTMIQSILRHAVKKGNIVISGRGGQALFQKTPGVYHIRIVAPLDIRLRNVMESVVCDKNDAQKIIKKHDAAAAEYLKKTYKINWDNPDLYHLVINTGKIDFDRAAKAIIEIVN